MKNNFIIILLLIWLTCPLCSQQVINLDLRTAQTMAVMNNKDIKVDKMKQRVMERGYIFGLIKFFPQFSTSYSFSNLILHHIESQQNIFYAVPYTHSFTFTVSQMVFDGGVTLSNTYLTYYDIGLARKRIEEKILVIETDIDALYSEVYFLYKKVKHMELNIEFLSREQEIIEKKLELDLITDLEYNDFLIKINEAQIKLAQERRKYNFMLDELKYTLGIEEQVEINLTSELEIRDMEIDEKDIEVFIDMAYSMTSTGNSKRLELYRAKAEQVMTYMSLLPTCNVNFSYTFEGDQWPLYRKGWELGINFTWALPGFPIEYSNSAKFPSDNSENQDVINQETEMLGDVRTSTSIKYFNGLESLNKFSESNIKMFQAQTEYETYLAETKKNIKKAVKEYNEFVQMARLNRDRERLLEKKLMIEKVKFEQGTGRLIDVLESEMKLYETRLNIIDINNKIYKNIIMLRKLTGLSIGEFYALIS